MPVPANGPLPTANPRPLLEVENLAKAYNGRLVLTVGQLSLGDGERVLLTGENGSGKSTLLRMLAGIVPADQGVIRNAPDLGKDTLGYVPQSGGLYPHLSLREHLILRRLLKGTASTTGDAAFLDDLALGPFIDRPYRDLSGGYQRLAALALALQDPVSWLLIDEPFNGVDLPKRELAFAVLSKVLPTLRLVVIVTPVGGEIPFINRRITLDGGRIA